MLIKIPMGHALNGTLFSDFRINLRKPFLFRFDGEYALRRAFLGANAARNAFFVVYNGQIVLERYGAFGTVPGAKSAPYAAVSAIYAHFLAFVAVTARDIVFRRGRYAFKQFFGAIHYAPAAGYALLLIDYGYAAYYVYCVRRTLRNALRHTYAPHGAGFSAARKKLHRSAVPVTLIIVLVRTKLAAAAGAHHYRFLSRVRSSEHFRDKDFVGLGRGVAHTELRFAFYERRRESVAAGVAATAAIRSRQKRRHFIHPLIGHDGEFLRANGDQYREYHRKPRKKYNRYQYL